MKILPLSMLFAVWLAVVCPGACLAEQVRCQTADNVQTCTVTEPDVMKAQTPYPTILFHPGSFITVHAGGCVQSGGTGQTWHRYVDPSGPNSDHLYHGLISYPGSGGLVRFAPASQTSGGWTFQVPTNALDNVPLVLGFEDDDYADNGYWGHDRDNGPNGQCPTPGTPDAENGKPAWVTISMASTGTVPEHKAMDLVSDTIDPNNLPSNPWWDYEKRAGCIPGEIPCPPDPQKQCGLTYKDSDNVDLGIDLLGDDCTTQSPSVNQGTGFNGELCRGSALHGVLAGHLNWFVSTYTGRITWDEWSGTFKPTDPLKSGDDDYNLKLFPEHGTGLTAARPQWIGLEFDSDEVVDRIDKGWWNTFHDQVESDGGPTGDTAQSIANAPAIVIGLMGLDSEHGAYSELHPVYGMAIHLHADSGNAQSDEWSFFARNYGNEGYCSDGNMTVPQLTTMSFFIPRPDAIGDDPTNPTALGDLYSTSDTNSVALSFVPGGAFITFTLGDPGDETLYSGKVRFNWKLQPEAPGRITASHGATAVLRGDALLRGGLTTAVVGNRPALGPDQVFVNGVPTTIDVDAEGMKEKVLEEFPATFRPALNDLLTLTPQTPHAVPVHRAVDRTVRAVGSELAPAAVARRSASPSYIRAVAMPDPEASERQAQLLRLFCQAYPSGVSPALTTSACARPTVRPRPHR